MSFPNMLKQLKRKLRAKKRWLSLGAFLLLAGIAAVLSPLADKIGPQPATPAWSRMTAAPAGQEERRLESQALEAVKRDGRARDVVALKRYVCGEEQRKLGAMKPDGILRLHGEHPDWRMSLGDAGRVVFLQTIDDLSPDCKANGYFGLDKKGNLSLFDGLPEHEKIIRTFFQLNIGHLKSSLPRETFDELIHGIRVTDLAEYDSVLSTFSDYAVFEAGPGQGSEKAGT